MTLFRHIIMTLPHLFIMTLYHHIIMTLSHHIIRTLSLHIIMTFHHHIIMTLSHHIIMTLPHNVPARTDASISPPGQQDGTHYTTLERVLQTMIFCRHQLYQHIYGEMHGKGNFALFSHFSVSRICDLFLSLLVVYVICF